MPPTGSAFTDWQQVDAAERRLLMDEDFSWSEPPARTRRRSVEESPASRRRTAVAEREREDARQSRDDAARARASKTESEFDALMQRWNDSYGEGARAGMTAADMAPADVTSADMAPADMAPADMASVGMVPADRETALAGATAYRASDVADIDAFDYDDLARYTEAPVVEDPLGEYVDDSGRRTVVITGRGAERYSPSPRRRPSSDLRFHERSGFSPDRTAMWAVLLGLALLVGCIVH